MNHLCAIGWSVMVGVILASSGACSSSHEVRDGGVASDGRVSEGDAALDAESGLDASACSGTCAAHRALDVLVVLEGASAFNSSNDPMLPLASEFVQLSEEFDLRVGVVSPDLGAGGAGVVGPDMGSLVSDVPGCTRRGAEAGLRSAPDGTPFVDVSPGADAMELAQNLRSRAHVPECVFEQPLEAMLLAVSPHSSSWESVAGTPQGDASNAGFLREGALLSVVIMAEVNDCSSSELGLYRFSSSVYESSLELRCFAFPGPLWPIQRYVSGLLAIKDAQGLSFFVYGGVPKDLEGASYGEILDDARMQEEIDVTAIPLRVRPSCADPISGQSLWPPRRQIETAMALEAEGVATAHGSACEPDRVRAFRPLGEVVRRSAARCCPTGS